MNESGRVQAPTLDAQDFEPTQLADLCQERVGDRARSSREPDLVHASEGVDADQTHEPSGPDDTASKRAGPTSRRFDEVGGIGARGDLPVVPDVPSRLADRGHDLALLVNCPKVPAEQAAGHEHQNHRAPNAQGPSAPSARM